MAPERPLPSGLDVQAASANMIATAAERPVRVFILLLPSCEQTDQHSQECEPPSQSHPCSTASPAISPILVLSVLCLKG
jgi:hypothetical protein